MDSPAQHSGGSGSSGSGGSGVRLAARNPKKRAGRKKFKETRHPVYRGIRRKKSEKWVCELREPTQQKRVWLGTYPTAEMAARAHDVAALAFRGKSACLNFADSASCGLPIPASMEARDIRKAASQAAEMFRSRDAQTASDVDQARQGNVKAEAHEAGPSSTKPEVDLKALSENMFPTDEDFPGLLHDMAIGMLIDPPNFGNFTSSNDIGNEDEDVLLWNLWNE